VSIATLSLGVVSADDSSTHAGFQSISNGIKKIGMSSSFGLGLSNFVRDAPIIYVSAELFRGEGVLPPFYVCMVDGVVEEVCMVVYSCDVDWRGCDVLG
jgi:hypothetical protein